MTNEYDELKSLLKKTRILMEQSTINNMAKSIENKINNDNEYETSDDSDDSNQAPVKKDKSKSYRISGGLLTIHGKEKKDLELTTEEKTSFQETMDEFINEVSDLVDFNKLNLYPNNVEWSGKIIDFDIEFLFSIGEDSGIYINGDMIKTDDEFLTMITKLKSFYEKFKSKWSRVLASRKKTVKSDE